MHNGSRWWGEREGDRTDDWGEGREKSYMLGKEEEAKEGREGMKETVRCQKWK